MALPNSLVSREKDKFVLNGSNVCIRLVGIAGAVSAYSGSRNNGEHDKFVLNGSGDTAIRVKVS